MNRILLAICLPFFLASCAVVVNRGTLADLHNEQPQLKDETVEDGLEKAMQSYRHFLEQTPETSMTPEALRRLADLKLEQEYGYVQKGAKTAPAAAPAAVIPKPALDKPQIAAPVEASVTGKNIAEAGGIVAGKESQKDFEKRISKGEKLKSKKEKLIAAPTAEAAADLENANAREAVELYKKLLVKYPLYERNDQVLYQLSRAYQELGEVEKAMDVLNRFVKTYPNSRYMDEVQFRRAEYFFTRKKFLDAEDAYKAVVTMGKGSSYFELALHKLGWSLYKQELYDEGVEKFVELLDYKVSIGYDFKQQHDQTEAQRIDDTFRVISLSFSNLGGASSIVEFFGRHGKRDYEEKVYSHLADFYLDKRRYSDAATAYKTFVDLYPFHEVSPQFHMRIIEIYQKGGFGKLVVEQKKEFAKTYALNAEYWRYFDVKKRPDVVAILKVNLGDLASFYHAGYQKSVTPDEKRENYREALLWYRNYLTSFPSEPESPAINYHMADLMLENKDFGEAAVAYEHTAYDYPAHEKSSTAGYSAVYAHRENLAVAGPDEKNRIKRDVIRSSLKFADSFPKHEKAALVMGAAIDDIYATKDYAFALQTGRKLLNNFPGADRNIVRGAWLIIGHSSFELVNFKDAEEAYFNVLKLMPEDDKTRPDVVENYAASIYKQGELANKASDFKTAAGHFLRVAKAAPTCSIRATADYDGATALMQLKDWDRAAEVLTAFRTDYPGHKLQPDVTKKIAYVYKVAGKLALAAAEYERIETETQDVAVRREALQLAADLYVDAKQTDKAMQVYQRYVSYFPKPLGTALETRNKIANVLKSRNETNAYTEQLKLIVAADLHAGPERTDRTRYLGATASLALTVPLFDQFVQIKLVKPFDKNLKQKKLAMKAAKEGLEKLLSYEVGDVTSAATYYIAEMYYNFNRSLIESERPDDLSALEKEQYELALEDQAYPFEEKTIQIHEKNLELLSLGIYSPWIDKSIETLAKLVPARYAKFEESSGYVAAIESVNYADLTNPEPILAKVEPVPATLQQAVESELAVAQTQVVASVQAEVPPVVAAKPVSGKKVAKPKKAKPSVQAK
jgi:outer membrane protein assembly factor BamD (BamD/ComL family)